MMKENWLAAALTNDALVAELLLRLKQSSSSDSSRAPPPPTAAAATTSSLNPLGWGNRKSRSKPPTTTTVTVTVTVTNSFRKEQQQRSPSTPLSLSGGGAASTSDGYDESSRLSDLSSGGRSTQAAFANEDSRKRKSFGELKEEEGFLLKERGHLNRDLASMRATLNQEMAIGDNLKKLRIDFHQNPEKEASQFVQMSSCKVESEIETRVRPFVLPDLNMTPADEELVMP